VPGEEPSLVPAIQGFSGPEAGEQKVLVAMQQNWPVAEVLGFFKD